VENKNKNGKRNGLKAILFPFKYLKKLPDHFWMG